MRVAQSSVKSHTNSLLYGSEARIPEQRVTTAQAFHKFAAKSDPNLQIGLN